MSRRCEMKTLASAALCLAVAACTMGPDFVRPQAGLPAQWQGEAVTTTPLDDDAAWWAGFHDPLLGQLAGQVLQSNLDLQLAANRVQQSRSARGISAADRLPSVAASASGVRARNSEVGLSDPSGNAGREDFGLFQAGIGLSWELDLWGRVRRQVEAADARVQMAEEDAHAVRIALLAETARSYLQLRATAQLLAITEDNLGIAADIQRLTEARQRQGVARALRRRWPRCRHASPRCGTASPSCAMHWPSCWPGHRRQWMRSCRTCVPTGRRCRRWRWGCPANWPNADRTSAAPKQRCMRPPRTSAWPRPASCRASP